MSNKKMNRRQKNDTRAAQRAVCRTDIAARTCVLSMRGIFPFISRCCAYEFEETVCAMEGADLLAPQAHRQPEQPSRSRIRRIISRRMPCTVSFKPKVEPICVDRPYDVTLVAVQSPPDLTQLRAVRGWREKSHVAICYIEEVWRAWIEQYSNSTSPIHLLKEFDHVFVTCQGSVNALQQVIQRPVHYIAPGVDALRFRPTRGIRSTDVYYMGRRSTVTHDALIRLLEAREITYAFDSILGRDVQNTRQHRQLLAGTIQNARYFIVHKAKADRHDHTFGQEEVGLRYFEGAAGGAVMVGSAPPIEAFDQYFDWPDAVIPMNYDCPEIGEFIADLNGQSERMERVRCENVVQSLRRHDWCYRWSEMLEKVGLPIGEGVAHRASDLGAAADQVKGIYCDHAAARNGMQISQETSG